jgi:hypothetical protein
LGCEWSFVIGCHPFLRSSQDPRVFVQSIDLGGEVWTGVVVLG